MTTLENESEKKRNNHLYNVLGKEVDDEESIVEVVNYEPVELATVITRIDITKIRGVGPSVAEKLRGGGFRTVEQIANTTVGQLMDIRSIGQATAQKILEGAKALLPSKNLVNFPQASQVTTPSPHIVQELSVDIIELEPVLEDESEEIFEPEVEERDLETKVEMKRLLQKAITSPELVQRPVPISPNHKIEKASQRTSSEKINREDKIKIIQRIVSEARELGYENLKVVPSLRKIYSLVDLVMFKVIPFNEILDLIVIVPIKVSNLKGNLQISNETIRYIPYDQGINEGSVYKSLLDSCFNQLDECQGLIYQDLREEGHFIDYLRRFHNVDISLKKTILKRNLSFNSGNQQIKILVEPILLCENEIGFLEKI